MPYNHYRYLFAKKKNVLCLFFWIRKSKNANRITVVAILVLKYSPYIIPIIAPIKIVAIGLFIIITFYFVARFL